MLKYYGQVLEAYNYIQAKQLNCEIITMPPKIISKILTFKKDLQNLQ